MQITKVKYQEIESLRIVYLNSLPLFQELYLEWLVNDSEYYKLEENSELIGYTIKLLNACLMSFNRYKLIGSLFRDLVQKDNYFKNDLKIGIADEHDLPFLLEQQDGLYETPMELEMCVKNGNIILFNNDNQLIGCGFLIKVHEKWDYYDIGMWVNPTCRKQRFATQIISYLKETCLKNDWIPICGCAFENIASQKTLEKNGFISKHKLIEFEVLS